MIPRRLLLLLILVLLGQAVASAGQPPLPAVPPERLAVLRRGVNITNWFRFPASRNPALLRAYIADTAIANLRRVGFSFVRLAVQPDMLTDARMLATLTASVARLERQGLGVIVGLHPASWRLETSEADRASFLASWRTLAPALRALDPRLTFPELLNEPVFRGAAGAWSNLQHRILTDVRAMLPANTILLTGNDWGSIDGLQSMVPEPDANTVYSFHFYAPPELTALAAYRPGVDAAALARLPFPADDMGACQAVADTTPDQPTAGLIRFYCAQHWNAAKLAARIGAAAEWARRNHRVVLAGEFGASQRLNAAARLAWLATVRAACEQAGIGWALWGYDDTMGFAMQQPPRDRIDLDAGILRALGLAGAIFGK